MIRKRSRRLKARMKLDQVSFKVLRENTLVGLLPVVNYHSFLQVMMTNTQRKTPQGEYL